MEPYTRDMQIFSFFWVWLFYFEWFLYYSITIRKWCIVSMTNYSFNSIKYGQRKFNYVLIKICSYHWSSSSTRVPIRYIVWFLFLYSHWEKFGLKCLTLKKKLFEQNWLLLINFAFLIFAPIRYIVWFLFLCSYHWLSSST